VTLLGELCVWAAVPFVLLGAAASIAGGWKGRRGLAALGARSAEAAAALLFLGLIGLAVALLDVRLEYSYVASHSGFQQGWPWRLAGLWSGPAGAALSLAFLLAAAATLSARWPATRGAAARTGALCTLALFGLLIVARTAPFARSVEARLVGSGLPLPVQTLAWQAEAIAVLLALGCAGFAFAGLLGQQLVESPGREGAERGALMLAAGLLTVALLAAMWRAYAGDGRLLDSTGAGLVVAHVPAWLLAVAYLHAPGGLAVPAWAIRWRRILGVALFPALLGDAAALLAAQGAPPPAVPLVGALAVGILSGAMAGMARGRWWTGRMERVPGFGAYAGLGGLVAFSMGGLAAAWALTRGVAFVHLGWLLALLGLTAEATWGAFRPAGRWKRVWPVAFSVSTAGAVIVFATTQLTELALVSGLAMGIAVGLWADVMRIAGARRAQRRAAVEHDERGRAAVFRYRNERRWSAALAHLAVALLVVGLAADGLRRTETRSLQPGATLSSGPQDGEGVRVTYLGLSRYQVGELDREVASFRLDVPGGEPRLITARRTFDWTTRRQLQSPGLQPGLSRDVIVAIAGRASGDGILCRLTVRPLASLVWAGGLLLVVAVLVRTRSAP